MSGRHPISPAESLPAEGDLTVCLQRCAGERGFQLDAAQQFAARHLQRLCDDLVQDAGRHQFPFFGRFAGGKQARGVYLWGGVGRGKSFLMDSFFSCAPIGHKKRVHFHRFMQEIHGGLAAATGHADPLTLVARQFASHTRLLCLDEFHVNDIADAMLMRGLVQALLAEGVAMVITSNHEPDDLYRNGLQRGQFLPAIVLIKERFDVVRVEAGGDYRLRPAEQVQRYHFPLDEASERALAAVFEPAGCEVERSVALDIAGRPLVALCCATGVAWFDFQQLCGGPRGKADYIEIARRFSTVLVSGLPRMTPALAAETCRFVWMVDEFYDRRVKLILSAEAALEDLYHNALIGEDFNRTLSRLREMQSREYFALPHLP